MQTTGCGSTSYVCADAGLCPFENQTACVAHDDCSWQSRCLPRGCANSTGGEAECAAMPGCTWQTTPVPGCAQDANAAPCAAPADAPSCSALPHCTWKTSCEVTSATGCSEANSSSECTAVGHCKWVKTGDFTLG